MHLKTIILKKDILLVYIWSIFCISNVKFPNFIIPINSKIKKMLLNLLSLFIKKFKIKTKLGELTKNWVSCPKLLGELSKGIG